MAPFVPLFRNAHLLDPFAVAVGAAGAEEEHGEALVVVAPLADLFALVEDGAANAPPGPLQRGLLEIGIAAVERGVAGIAKCAPAWPPAQLADGFAAHPYMLAGGADAAAVGELLDEGDLAFCGPAVVAGADGDRGELDGKFR